MPDQLLNLLQLFLLVLLYLFFLRVLRAVWTEVSSSSAAERQIAQAGAPAAPAPRANSQPKRERRLRSGPTQLRVVEPARLRGRSYGLAEELTLGRAAGCHVLLEDAYASQVHARVFSRDGTWFIEDLGSTNGTYLNRQRVAGPMVIKRRDRLQIGNTVLEMT